MIDSTKELESALRRIPGVLGIVFIGNPRELQVFTRPGSNEGQVRQDLARVLSEHQMLQEIERVFVFEFAGAPSLTGRPGRPLIGNISLSVSGPQAEARVNLRLDDRESEGTGSGPAGSYSLRVMAATTLEAAQAFLGQKGIFTLEGASLVEAVEHKVVLVLVNSALGMHNPVVGASMVGDSPIYEATVRATLDAVNRHLALALL